MTEMPVFENSNMSIMEGICCFYSHDDNNDIYGRHEGMITVMMTVISVKITSLDSRQNDSP
jgi:hypothetical protein